MTKAQFNRLKIGDVINGRCGETITISVVRPPNKVFSHQTYTGLTSEDFTINAFAYGYWTLVSNSPVVCV